MKDYDVHERIFNFIVEVIKFLNKLPSPWVYKEGKETVYWLRLIERTNLDKFSTEVIDLVREGSEIVAIVSTIIKNTSISKKDRK